MRPLRRRHTLQHDLNVLPVIVRQIIVCRPTPHHPTKPIPCQTHPSPPSRRSPSPRRCRWPRHRGAFPRGLLVRNHEQRHRALRHDRHLKTLLLFTSDLRIGMTSSLRAIILQASPAPGSDTSRCHESYDNIVNRYSTTNSEFVRNTTNQSEIKEALINLQKLLKAIKEHQTEGILQRFLKF